MHVCALVLFSLRLKDKLQKLLLLLSSTSPLASDHSWTSEECLSHHVQTTCLVDEHNWLGRRGWTWFPFCRVKHTNCPCQVIMSALFNGTIKNFTSNLASWSECVLIAQLGGSTAAAAPKQIVCMVCLHLLVKKTKQQMKTGWKGSWTTEKSKIEEELNLHQLFKIRPKHSASFKNEEVGLRYKKKHNFVSRFWTA